MEHVPFTEAADPYGYLEAMAKTDYIHGEENVVHYYTCHMNKDGVKT